MRIGTPAPRWRLALAGTLSLCVAAAASAQQSTPLAQGQDVLTTPALWRVLASFLLVAALAVGVVFALRRILPRFGAPITSDGALRVLSRASPSPGLRLHVVQIDQERLVLAESRHGVAMLALRSADASRNDREGSQP